MDKEIKKDLLESIQCVDFSENDAKTIIDYIESLEQRIEKLENQIKNKIKNWQDTGPL
jgi:polyhydroxyalkanoate synthesis regulator phasin